MAGTRFFLQVPNRFTGAAMTAPTNEQQSTTLVDLGFTEPTDRVNGVWTLSVEKAVNTVDGFTAGTPIVIWNRNLKFTSTGTASANGGSLITQVAGGANIFGVHLVFVNCNIEFNYSHAPTITQWWPTAFYQGGLAPYRASATATTVAVGGGDTVAANSNSVSFWGCDITNTSAASGACVDVRFVCTDLIHSVVKNRTSDATYSTDTNRVFEVVLVSSAVVYGSVLDGSQSLQPCNLHHEGSGIAYNPKALNGLATSAGLADGVQPLLLINATPAFYSNNQDGIFGGTLQVHDYQLDGLQLFARANTTAITSVGIQSMNGSAAVYTDQNQSGWWHSVTLLNPITQIDDSLAAGVTPQAYILSKYSGSRGPVAVLESIGVDPYFYTDILSPSTSATSNVQIKASYGFQYATAGTITSLAAGSTISTYTSNSSGKISAASAFDPYSGNSATDLASKGLRVPYRKYVPNPLVATDSVIAVHSVASFSSTVAMRAAGRRINNADTSYMLTLDTAAAKTNKSGRALVSAVPAPVRATAKPAFVVAVTTNNTAANNYFSAVSNWAVQDIGDYVDYRWSVFDTNANPVIYTADNLLDLGAQNLVFNTAGTLGFATATQTWTIPSGVPLSGNVGAGITTTGTITIAGMVNNVDCKLVAANIVLTGNAAVRGNLSVTNALSGLLTTAGEILAEGYVNFGTSSTINLAVGTSSFNNMRLAGNLAVTTTAGNPTLKLNNCQGSCSISISSARYLQIVLKGTSRRTLLPATLPARVSVVQELLVEGLDPQGFGVTWVLCIISQDAYAAANKSNPPSTWAGCAMQSGTGNTFDAALTPGTAYRILYRAPGYSAVEATVDLNADSAVTMAPVADVDLSGNALWTLASSSTKAANFTYNADGFIEYANNTGATETASFYDFYRAVELLYLSADLAFTVTIPLVMNGTKDGITVPPSHPLLLRMTAASTGALLVQCSLTYPSTANATDRVRANTANAGGYLPSFAPVLTISTDAIAAVQAGLATIEEVRLATSNLATSHEVEQVLNELGDVIVHTPATFTTVLSVTAQGALALYKTTGVTVAFSGNQVTISGGVYKYGPGGWNFQLTGFATAIEIGDIFSIGLVSFSGNIADVNMDVKQGSAGNISAALDVDVTLSAGRTTTTTARAAFTLYQTILRIATTSGEAWSVTLDLSNFVKRQATAAENHVKTDPVIKQNSLLIPSLATADQLVQAVHPLASSEEVEQVLRELNDVIVYQPASYNTLLSVTAQGALALYRTTGVTVTWANNQVTLTGAAYTGGAGTWNFQLTGFSTGIQAGDIFSIGVVAFSETVRAVSMDVRQGSVGHISAALELSASMSAGAVTMTQAKAAFTLYQTLIAVATTSGVAWSVTLDLATLVKRQTSAAQNFVKTDQQITQNVLLIPSLATAVAGIPTATADAVWAKELP